MQHAVARPRRRRGYPTPVVLLPWIVALGILVGAPVWAHFAAPPQGGVPPPGSAGALVWGDGVFSRPATLDAWLRVHGVEYRRWAKKHPAAVALITGRTAPPPKTAVVTRK